MLVKSVENKDVGVNGKSSNIINQMVGCLKITASGLKSKEVFASCLGAKLGFFRRVKDFVFGRHGCGNIKFMAEMTMQAAAAAMMIKTTRSRRCSRGCCSSVVSESGCWLTTCSWSKSP